jgi:hypothetical protein
VKNGLFAFFGEKACFSEQFALILQAKKNIHNEHNKNSN